MSLLSSNGALRTDLAAIPLSSDFGVFAFTAPGASNDLNIPPPSPFLFSSRPTTGNEESPATELRRYASVLSTQADDSDGPHTKASAPPSPAANIPATQMEHFVVRDNDSPFPVRQVVSPDPSAVQAYVVLSTSGSRQNSDMSNPILPAFQSSFITFLKGV